MLAKLARVDSDLLYPIEHSCEDTQVDFLPIKMRDCLVSQRVNIANTIRGSIKALGIRIPSASTRGLADVARLYLAQNHPQILPSISPMLDTLDFLKKQICNYDKSINKDYRQ